MNTSEANKLKLFEVTLRVTGEKHYAVDYNAQDACLQAGWLIGDCYVVEQKPLAKLDKHERSILFIKIPCQVCPYQFTECKKPSETECPTRPDTSDPVEWQRQISKSHFCPHTGEDLSKRDYQKRLKRVPLEEATKELASKPPITPPNPPEPTCHSPQPVS